MPVVMAVSRYNTRKTNMVGRYAVLKSLEVVQLAINYTPLSMAYYVYDSTANFYF